MPFKYQLTWLPSRKRWAKTYLGKRHYLKTRTNGKKDREGYLAAYREWERLRDYLDGIGPNPYGPNGNLLPAGVIPSLPVESHRTLTVAPKPAPQRAVVASVPQVAELPDSPFILGIGLCYEQAMKPGTALPCPTEDGIFTLIRTWVEHRRQLAERGELSLKQWSEDGIKIGTFRDFMLANYPGLHSIDHLTGTILNQYRDKQWEFVDCGGEGSISRATLKKRLSILCKWLRWLVDENYLEAPPKDLRSYAKVKLDPPQPLFFTADELKQLFSVATQRTRLFMLLGLNLGATQREIATLEAKMIDWETGIVTRPRHKTGVPSRNILWPRTLKQLRILRSTKRGPLLVGNTGNPLVEEYINSEGKLSLHDAVSKAFARTMKQAKLEGHKRSFKHLRKTAANEIEKRDPTLTPLFLAHSEQGVKRHYVDTHYDRLFEAVLELEAVLLAS
ncbi:hypothetical protein KOR34_44870 [Posidoniimonas corsicana]|uniref:Tyr recombinase domain-containing protein n=1 Tax=Posidoniimonas corsicana TaxID=1938618 RepID=A0A5C5UZL7_9BACT|nr:hypothetical protein [Posidoniimonas corsicana]TWT31113.1 hypothetical protein KOR34_44870 [Posidoniimonas corsicana]